jgi:hypothetical protein
VRSFEVFVAQVSNDASKQVMFSSVPAEADRQQQQLRGVMHRLGATPRTPVTHPERRRRWATIFGRGGERRPDRSRARLFSSLDANLACRSGRQGLAGRHAARPRGSCLADTIEHIRWRLWHGQVQRALDLIGDTLVILDAAAETASPHAATAGSVALHLIRVFFTFRACLKLAFALCH